MTECVFCSAYFFGPFVFDLRNSLSIKKSNFPVFLVNEFVLNVVHLYKKKGTKCSILAKEKQI